MVKLPSVKNVNVEGKRVILRADFNVLVEKGSVEGAFRIEQTLPTIKLLKKKGAKIILISHITAGRASGLELMAKYLNKYFKVDFISDLNLEAAGRKIENMKNGDIVMLENIRIHEGEENNDRRFAKRLASLGDIYVNDAFSASHRKHASIVGVPKYLPSYAGLLFETEYKNLQAAFKPTHPFLLILGGVKFGTKLGVLKKFLKIADKIFIGGGLANNFLAERGWDIGGSIVDASVDIKKYLNNPKIILPMDVRKKENIILDVGDQTIYELEEIIKQTKFILWNGPLGNFEQKGFDKGTKDLAEAIVKSRARAIVGGGDTVALLSKLGLLKKFFFVSTAGGAMLEFLAQGTLPGIEALKKK